MRGKIIGLLLMISMSSLGQEVLVKGGFVQDSLKIGEEVNFWLSAKYPYNFDILLPDSTFNFEPFEFGGRRYFETLADSSLAVDSVVYSLQSFEINPIQYLNLPALILRNGDTTMVHSDLDSIRLVELVKAPSDTTALVTNTELQEVSTEFNSPLLMIILGIFILITLVIVFIFGKKILRHFKLKRMAMAHESFIETLEHLISKMKGTAEPEVAEEAITIWKQYLEKIEKRPVTKLTSKEIVAYDFAKELREPLKAVDRCVYGKMPSETVYQDFENLEDFAQNRYDHRISKIKLGEG